MDFKTKSNHAILTVLYRERG